MLRRGSWTTGGKGKKGPSPSNEGESPLGSPGVDGYGDGEDDGEAEAVEEVEAVDGTEVRMIPILPFSFHF